MNLQSFKLINSPRYYTSYSIRLSFQRVVLACCNNKIARLRSDLTLLFCARRSVSCFLDFSLYLCRTLRYWCDSTRCEEFGWRNL